jgi:hypothetical protein
MGTTTPAGATDTSHGTSMTAPAGDGEVPGEGATGTGFAAPTGSSVPLIGSPSSSGGSTSTAPSGAGTFESGAGGGSSSLPVSGAPASGTLPSTPADGSSTSVVGSSTDVGAGSVLPQPGILTAGTWDDNLNYARFTDYRHSSDIAQLPGLVPLTDQEFDASHQEFSGTRAAKKTLDISLVIDTTGSMGDELSYLQSEFMAMSQAIESTYPNAEQRWSLVVYRDTVDEYIVRWFDFRTDAEDFRENLAAQSADGGGDYPESPERGLSQMSKLSWRTDADTAKIAFWVADAPHHDNQAGAMAQAILAAHTAGVHVYPVAASGVDDLTEDTMRSTAQITGGRYLFLTNDSGVGDDHKEPTIPCYFVTHLDDAILRMVDIELTGKYHEPDPSQILRTGGNPQDGACTTESGQTVQIF